MFPFSQVDSMSTPAILATTQAMLKIAGVDGMQAAELELIRNFYEQSGGTDLPDFATLQEKAPLNRHIDPHALASAAEKEMLLALCVMTGYADGELSTAELAAIQSIAGDLGMADQVDAIIARVKDFMLAQLAHLPDAASVAQVARELG